MLQGFDLAARQVGAMACIRVVAGFRAGTSRLGFSVGLDDEDGGDGDVYEVIPRRWPVWYGAGGRSY